MASHIKLLSTMQMNLKAINTHTALSLNHNQSRNLLIVFIVKRRGQVLPTLPSYERTRLKP